LQLYRKSNAGVKGLFNFAKSLMFNLIFDKYYDQ
jgi:hypothetical protein